MSSKKIPSKVNFLLGDSLLCIMLFRVNVLVEDDEAGDDVEGLCPDSPEVGHEDVDALKVRRHQVYYFSYRRLAPSAVCHPQGL